MPLRAGLTYRERHKAEPYAEALRRAGIEPVLISPAEPRDLAGLQGLLLSGGTDLNPARYGQRAGMHDETPDDARDDLEAALLQRAIDTDLPVLAICRGMQLFNVAHGGTLIQHLDSPVHRLAGRDRAVPVHSIRVEPGSRLAAIMGDGVHAVNSRHHQAVGRVGDGLHISAKCDADGVIEGLERSDRSFAIAVQWHPEDQVADPVQRKLFDAFAQALAAGQRS